MDKLKGVSSETVETNEDGTPVETQPSSDTEAQTESETDGQGQSETQPAEGEV